jgi:hypothetical protein
MPRGQRDRSLRPILGFLDRVLLDYTYTIGYNSNYVTKVLIRNFSYLFMAFVVRATVLLIGDLYINQLENYGNNSRNCLQTCYRINAKYEKIYILIDVHVERLT